MVLSLKGCGGRGETPRRPRPKRELEGERFYDAFTRPSRSANVAGGAFREARGHVPGPLLSNIWSRRTTRMYSEFESFF